jgi:hypothetical protein
MDSTLQEKIFGNTENTRDLNPFAKGFLEMYLRDGLGVMSKKETEILVVSRLDELGIFRNLGNSEASRLLRIPESRIATLRYESLLRYPPDDSKVYVQRELMIALLRSDFDQEQTNGRIRLMIENKYVRSYLKGEFTKQGKVLDRSFDSDIASAKPEALFSVLGLLFHEDFVTHIKQSSGFDTSSLTKETWSATMTDIRTTLVENAVNWGVEQAGDIASFLSNFIA